MSGRQVHAAWLLPLALCCVAACTRQPGNVPQMAPQAKAAPSTSSSSATSSPEQPATSAQQAATQREVTEALKLVASVRKLEPKQPVAAVRLTRPELLQEISSLLAKSSPPALLHGTREVLFAADAVPPDFDIQKSIVGLYTSELAGFYEPKTKRMVLISDLSGEAQKMTLYHELVHALQDQHFDLTKSSDWKPELSDQQAAIHAVAEGDATAAMLEVFSAVSNAGSGGAGLSSEGQLTALQLQAMLSQADPALKSMPGVMLRSMLAPYTDGLAFVQALRKTGEGWSDVDAAFKQPPETTEQLLHVLKYLAREPSHLPAPLTSPQGFEELYRDVMGEQGTRILFEEWTTAELAALAASDWDGDRVAAYRRGSSEYTVHWHLVFDTETAASRALTTIARGAGREELPPNSDATALAVRRFASAKTAEDSAKKRELCQARAQRGPFAAARQGRHIGVVFGPYERTPTNVRSTGTCPDALNAARSLARAQ